MSERRSVADSGPSLEDALSGFPFPERDWEKEALAALARISRTELGSTEASLLAAPLPSEPGEPASASSAVATPLTSSGVRTHSLTELARRSVENNQAAERELARASLALAAERRRKAFDVLALREAMSSKLTPSAPRPAAVPPVPVTASVPVGAGGSWPKLGIAAATLALAAGALFWLRQPAPAALINTALPTPAQASEAASGSSSAIGVAAQAAPFGVDPSSLPGESPSKPAEAAREKAPGAAAHAASASVPGAEKVVLQGKPERAPSVAAARAEIPVEKTLPPDPGLRPADSTGGALPAKPSTGAVQAALAAVMSSARQCVAGDDAPSSARVVFASDGRVRSVAVSGHASGTPSGSCIQAQLARARVQPFAAPTFSVSATVRPE